LGRRQKWKFYTKEQKNQVIDIVTTYSGAIIPRYKVLEILEVNSTTYYSWFSQKDSRPPSVLRILPEERNAIIDLKQDEPQLSHRMIAGYLRHDNIWVSDSTSYNVLKQEGLIEKTTYRQAPWKDPKFEPWAPNQVWGTDFTYIRVENKRHYLAIIIDFYSRYIIAWGVVEKITSNEIKKLIDLAVSDQGKRNTINTTIHSDRGSQYVSKMTKRFISSMNLEQTLTRTARPTDNARTERWYRSFKQECHYVIGNYPTIQIARSVIAKYVNEYNTKRPHQSLFGFCPKQLHYEFKNKSEAYVMYKKMLVVSRVKRIKSNLSRRTRSFVNSVR